MGKETSGRTVRPLVREDLSWLLPLDAGSFAEAWTEDTWGDELEGRLSHYIALEEMGLAVDPRRRGEKLGLALVEAMVAEARKLEAVEMTLEVREGNTPARRTYDHLGFTECGRWPGYYGDNGEAAVLMRRDL